MTSSSLAQNAAHRAYQACMVYCYGPCVQVPSSYHQAVKYMQEKVKKIQCEFEVTNMEEERENAMVHTCMYTHADKHTQQLYAFRVPSTKV